MRQFSNFQPQPAVRSTVATRTEKKANGTATTVISISREGTPSSSAPLVSPEGAEDIERSSPHHRKSSSTVYIGGTVGESSTDPSATDFPLPPPPLVAPLEFPVVPPRPSKASPSRTPFRSPAWPRHRPARSEHLSLHESHPEYGRRPSLAIGARASKRIAS